MRMSTKDLRADPDIILWRVGDILYWLLANNPPQRGPLWWSQAQWDECAELREDLKKMATTFARRKRVRP